MVIDDIFISDLHRVLDQVTQFHYIYQRHYYVTLTLDIHIP